jgi:hypothetical protein
MTRVSAFAVKDYGANAPSAGGPQALRSLTEEMKNLKVKFDRAAYRKKYDATYFKKKTRCPNCGELRVKHMLKRHMQTKKCQRAADRLRSA